MQFFHNEMLELKLAWLYVNFFCLLDFFSFFFFFLILDGFKLIVSLISMQNFVAHHESYTFGFVHFGGMS